MHAPDLLYKRTELSCAAEVRVSRFAGLEFRGFGVLWVWRFVGLAFCGFGVLRVWRFAGLAFCGFGVLRVQGGGRWDRPPR